MFELGPGEQSELLGLARGALESFFQTLGVPVDRHYQPRHPSLQAAAAAFVSLHRGGKLRGCVGRLRADQPLSQIVPDLALAAALDDPRFLPVHSDELPDLDIEISILSPFSLVDQPEQIEVGRHGLMVTLGSQRGLVLPQVAAQRDWDWLRFCSETCRKAGLAPDGWRRRGAVLEKFEAQVFREARKREKLA
ncbi:MAG: AmmeMemoRadiSam system protein A [Acidobacteria bacterium]|nr:AmmeMemoRadiSam system protein A [Acidobacteriota bacterium]